MDLWRHARLERLAVLESDSRRSAGGETGSVDQRTIKWLATVQTLACRFWARSGLYQPEAFGFRDLQDAMALIHANRASSGTHPSLHGASVSRGDIWHWWHPPSAEACGLVAQVLPLAAVGRVITSRLLEHWCVGRIIHFIKGRPLGRGSLTTICPSIREKRPLYTIIARHRLGASIGEHGQPLMGSAGGMT
jgi:hypothetical protein